LKGRDLKITPPPLNIRLKTGGAEQFSGNIIEKIV
jgi:hypothetical protein